MLCGAVRCGAVRCATVGSCAELLSAKPEVATEMLCQLCLKDCAEVWSARFYSPSARAHVHKPGSPPDSALMVRTQVASVIALAQTFDVRTPRTFRRQMFQVRLGGALLMP